MQQQAAQVFHFVGSLGTLEAFAMAPIANVLFPGDSW